MIRRSLMFLLPLCGAWAGCSPAPTEFSAPKLVAPSLRPVRWGAPEEQRLRISEAATGTDHGQGQGERAPALVGDTPSGWEVKAPEPKRFRDLLWSVPGDPAGECFLTKFAGGAIEQNLARWYGQMGVAPASLDSLPRVPMAGQQGYLLELYGTYLGKADQGMLLAFLVREGGVTTLKLTGAATLVKAQRQAFLGLAASLREAGAAAASPPAPAAAGGEPAAGHAAGTVSGFVVQPPQPQRFRDLLWTVGGDASTECYLTAFVGGGVQQNLARWCGQFGAAPVELASLSRVPMAGESAYLLELSGSYQGKPDYYLLLAFLARGDGVTTLKCVGPAAVVRAHKEGFLELAKSLRPAAAGAAASAPATTPTPAPKTVPEQPAVPAGSGPFTATVPSAWQPKDGSTKLLHHTFGTGGEVYVSQLGGALRGMLDIWRGEVGLAAATDAEFQGLAKLPMLGGDGVLLDVAGDWRSMGGRKIDGARMLVGAYQDGNTITFVKLIGPAAEVAAELAAFRSFCSSLRRQS